MSKSAERHMKDAAKLASSVPIQCAILTISDTRTMETDSGGALIESSLKDAGHTICARSIVPDDPGRIRAQLNGWLDDQSVHVILTTGGTGISRRDTTIEVVRELLTLELDGFGELFRMLSFSEIKGAAMLSRAVSGLVIREADKGGETLIFSMPGSPNAVRLAMSELIVPQLPHLIWERRR